MSLQAVFGVLILLVALAIIPLSVLMATGSRSRAWGALKEYGLVIAAFALVGVLGLVSAAVEHGPTALIRLFTNG
ncbi:hypothetical protein [Roseateles aquatilis]|uniref:hypothetical protein n=1 Tax=Roseateles aquatilis TaxID=431061 RepID=UPI0011316E48|nr:hypothetical protein [Roseateles aquatilis]